MLGKLTALESPEAVEQVTLIAYKQDSAITCFFVGMMRISLALCDFIPIRYASADDGMGILDLVVNSGTHLAGMGCEGASDFGPCGVIRVVKGINLIRLDVPDVLVRCVVHRRSY